MTTPQIDPFSASLILGSLERIEGKVDTGVEKVAKVEVGLEAINDKLADHMAADHDMHERLTRAVEETNKRIDTTNGTVSKVRDSHNNLRIKVMTWAGIGALIVTATIEGAIKALASVLPGH